MAASATQFWKTLHVDGAPGHRFELLQEIASGGMATVYLACRRGPLGFERTVAIKRASGMGRRDPELWAQASREARLASRLHHPNVVSVIDVELVDDEPLLVMEYVEGASLAQIMAAGALTPTVIARVLTDVCEGLAAVHSARDEEGSSLGMVHRDISPQNVLVGLDGVARVADFGIALTRSSARTTSHDARRGKPGYMDPEYITSGEPAAACDLFALGVVLWEALTGRRLFARTKSLAELRQRHQRAVPAPSTLVAGLPAIWDEITLRALGRSSEPRFESAEELARAIERAGELAPRRQVGQLVDEIAHESIWLRRAIVREWQRASQLKTPEQSSIRRIRKHDSMTPRLALVDPTHEAIHEEPTRRERIEEAEPTSRLPMVGSSPGRLRAFGRSRGASAVVGVLVGLLVSAAASAHWGHGGARAVTRSLDAAAGRRL